MGPDLTSRVPGVTSNIFPAFDRLHLYLDMKFFRGEAIYYVTKMDDNSCEREVDDVGVSYMADGK